MSRFATAVLSISTKLENVPMFKDSASGPLSKLEMHMNESLGAFPEIFRTHVRLIWPLSSP